MEDKWTNSLVLVETFNGRVKVTFSNVENTEEKITTTLPSELAIQFAEAILVHAVHIEEQIQLAVERLSTIE
jgi:hypothetical protein